MWLSIGEYTQDRKYLWQSLNLVEHDESAQRFEREHRDLEARQVRGVFEVEVMGPAVEPRRDLLGEGGLTDLSGAHNGDDVKLAEQGQDSFEMPGSRNHNNEKRNIGFQISI